MRMTPVFVVLVVVLLEYSFKSTYKHADHKRIILVFPQVKLTRVGKTISRIIKLLMGYWQVVSLSLLLQ